MTLAPGGDPSDAVSALAAALRRNGPPDSVVIHNEAWPLLLVTGCKRVSASVRGGEDLHAEVRGEAAAGEAARPLGDEPVTDLSWKDAAAYCRWLTAQHDDGLAYRPPTEAEWEYVCRTGGASEGLGRTVGPATASASPPNSFGVRGLVDNVAELCLDFYAADYYARSPAADPKGPERGEDRSVRGGDWSTPRAWGDACTHRDYVDPGSRDHPNIGLRLVRSRLHPW